MKIPFYANKLVFSGDKKTISLEFPNSDSDCTKCGTSKRNILMNNTADDEISVFIGDGFSDACVVNYADIVFAKKSLASYCWKNNITYYDYNNFSDVKNKLIKLIGTNTIKQRRESSIRRKDIFMGG